MCIISPSLSLYVPLYLYLSLCLSPLCPLSFLLLYDISSFRTQRTWLSCRDVWYRVRLICILTTNNREDNSNTSHLFPLVPSPLLSRVCVCICVCIYVFLPLSIRSLSHTHTRTYHSCSFWQWCGANWSVCV